MEWICSVIAVMVAVALALRLLWWAYGRSHRLAGQTQSPTGSPTELNQTGSTAEEKKDK